LVLGLRTGEERQQEHGDGHGRDGEEGRFGASSSCLRSASKSL
jgi:hypothetical protein